MKSSSGDSIGPAALSRQVAYYWVRFYFCCGFTVSHGIRHVRRRNLGRRTAQSRFEEDDTLEKLASLIEELTERSHKRTVKLKKARKDKEKIEKEGVDDVVKRAVKEGVNPVPPQKQHK